MSKLNKDQIREILNNENFSFNFDEFFDLFSFAIDSCEEIIKTNMFGSVFQINETSLLFYLAEEFNQIVSLYETLSDEIKSKVVSIALDKYFTNEHLDYKNAHFVNKYSSEISTINTYINLMLGVLKKFPQKNPRETLLVDVMNKSLSISKAIINLIVDGFETEAFSTWRTLHESECILTLLARYKTPIIKSYLKHMNYGIAFRGGLNKEITDKVFEQIKGEMKAFDLKSKDMKKFIEYGWLASVTTIPKLEGFKFNFRDGVERAAELSNYSEIYEMASEIAHSSPLLIYSKNKYFFNLALLELYESFFRIEKIFCLLYVKNVSSEEENKFNLMRKTYYPMLANNYKKIKESFDKLNIKKASI